MKKLFTVLVLTFFLVGCGGDDRSSSSQVNRCENVPSFIISNIESGLEIEGGGSLKNAKAVKSNDFSSIYFISADLDGTGLEGDRDIATFATNKLDSAGLIFSIDHIAKEFSVFPFGKDTKTNITMSDDGAAESANCVN